MSTKKPIIHCDALVVHCMDYRLQKYLQPWITVRFGYDNFDIISLAGSVHDYEMVLKYVQLAVRIHGIDRSVLSTMKIAAPMDARELTNATNTICKTPKKRSQPCSPA